MFGKYWLEKKKIKAVHDDDLEKFLLSIGILDHIKEGHISCFICDIQINLDNLGIVIFSKNNQIKLVCNKFSCLEKIDVFQKDVDMKKHSVLYQYFSFSLF